MKGRNGEVGQFSIAWDFINMSFAQMYPTIDPVKKVDEAKELQWV